MADNDDKADDQKTLDYAADAAKATRDAAKWLATAFGALAAALIGNASLQDLSKLSADGETQAIVGLIVALVGALFVIVPSARVLASARVSVPAIAEATGSVRDWYKRRSRDDVQSHTTLLGGFPSLKELVDRHELYQHEQAKWFSKAKGLSPPPKPAWVPDSEVEAFEANAPDENPERALFKRAGDGLVVTNVAVGDVAEYLSAESVRQRFRWGLLPIVIGIFLAGIGAVMFGAAETQAQADAAAAKALDAATPAVDLDATPVVAELVIEDEAADVFRPLLGDNCDLKRLAVAVLGAEETTIEVLVLPQNACMPRRMEVETGQAELAPADDLSCAFQRSATGVVCD